MVLQLSQLKSQLENLKATYTDNHPDIIVTKKKIADLEKKLAEGTRVRLKKAREGTRPLTSTIISKRRGKPS